MILGRDCVIGAASTVIKDILGWSVLHPICAE